MSVYVDDMKAKYGRMIMSHLTADTLKELHDMADKIGVQRKWFQKPPKSSLPHYDISLSKRECAIECGAIEIEQIETVLHAKTLMIEWCRKNSSVHVDGAIKKRDAYERRLGAIMRKREREND